MTDITISNYINRMYVRACIKNQVYKNKSWMMYQSYEYILNNPPSTWNHPEYPLSLVIAWCEHKAIGALTNVFYIEQAYKPDGSKSNKLIRHTNIYVKPQYRSLGIGTKLVEAALKIPGVDKLNFISAGDENIFKIADRFPSKINVRGKRSQIG